MPIFLLKLIALVGIGIGVGLLGAIINPDPHEREHLEKPDK